MQTVKSCLEQGKLLIPNKTQNDKTYLFNIAVKLSNKFNNKNYGIQSKKGLIFNLITWWWTRKLHIKYSMLEIKISAIENTLNGALILNILK